MEPDKIIGTNYQLIRLLGKGGMGEAWLARSSGPRAEVALKFISEPLAHDPELRRRFEREARIQSALQNSNVVQILGGDFSGPLPFVVTEYCRSGNLNQVFSSASFSEMVQALLQVMQGLAAAHEQGVVHRDLKPTNILVHEKGLVKLADFGLAKLMERDTTTLTATGWGLGTLGYMAQSS